ncbi:MAG: lactate racemase domain-containing protein [Kiritimatiellia bacterium]
MTARGKGSPEQALDAGDVASICEAAAEEWRPDGKNVLFVIPDSTRTCPMDILFGALYKAFAPRVKKLDFLVALGTHPPMPEEAIHHMVGITAREHGEKFAKASFFNHAWRDDSQLKAIGTIPAREIESISENRLKMDVTITCNRMIESHDLIILVGPVFPHEVVGFSGGNKYLFPGIAGKEIIDFFHWLGALITNREIIGKKRTPVRKVVDRAARFVEKERRAFCLVVKEKHPAGIYYGTPEEAWSAAADLSTVVNIHCTDRLYDTVLSQAPGMYDDLWTGGKAMYKLEPVTARGGRIIIFAPHITEVSKVHGGVLLETGYHVRDFFLQQWDKYKEYPWGILAHSTHVKGMGGYSNNVEDPWVDVILATGIPEDTCRRINLGYMDWRNIDVKEYSGREEEGILYVPRAGETLYRYCQKSYENG